MDFTNRLSANVRYAPESSEARPAEVFRARIRSVLSPQGRLLLEAVQISMTMWLGFALAGVLVISGCLGPPEGPEPSEQRISIVLADLRGDTPTPYEPRDYERMLFDPTYTLTPPRPAFSTTTVSFTPDEGQPAGGSLKDYFSRHSQGRMKLQLGKNFGRVSVPRSWQDLLDEIPDEDESGICWYTTQLYQAVRGALLAAQASPSEVDQDPLLILVNHSFRGCANGNKIYLSAISDYGRIQAAGLVAHELGHLFLRQPDRYYTEYGNLGRWDVMGNDYDEFPAGFSAPGRVDAGWAMWARTQEPGLTLSSHSITLVPLPETQEIFTARARLGVAAPDSLFSLELRSKEVGAEALSSVYRSGVLLFEKDPWGMEGTTFPAGIQEPLFGMEMNYIRAKTSLIGQTKHFDDRPAWARPAAAAFGLPATDGFYCEDGSSLNVLGECLWSFESVRVAPQAVSATLNVVSRARVLESSLRSLHERAWSVEPSSSARRLYLENVNPGDRLVIRERESVRQMDRLLSAETLVMDLDRWSGELQIELISGRPFVQGGVAPKATLVGRGPALPRHSHVGEAAPDLSAPVAESGLVETPAGIVLRTGEEWGTAVAEVPFQQTLRISIPVDPLWPLLDRPSVEGVLRLVVAMDTSQSATLSGQEAPLDTLEGVRVRYCDLGDTIAFGCTSVVARQFLGTRREPVVFLIPLSRLTQCSDGTLLPWTGLWFDITREKAASHDRMWLLSADFVRTARSQ